jgi:hypothetical protein
MSFFSIEFISGCTLAIVSILIALRIWKQMQRTIFQGSGPGRYQQFFNRYNQFNEDLITQKVNRLELDFEENLFQIEREDSLFFPSQIKSNKLINRLVEATGIKACVIC